MKKKATKRMLYPDKILPGDSASEITDLDEESILF